MAKPRAAVGGLVRTDTVTPTEIKGIPAKTPRFADGRPDWLKQCTKLCKGACCKYIGVPIDPCTNARDWDDWRWYLAHEGISIYKDDGQWYLNIETRCNYLTRDLKCEIYETRPATCAEYDPSACEWQDPEAVWQIHFETPADLERFLREKKDRRNAAARKRRQAARGSGKASAARNGKSRNGKARNGKASRSGR